MLFIIATPIGHLQDITLRALETLHSCDYILCEDTRHFLKLAHHHHIRKPLKSLHKFNEAKQQAAILHDLDSGLRIGLVSDGGTPTISDPGGRLVQACREHQIPCIPIPGPCSIIAALSASGLLHERWQFLGFLPKKSGKKKATLQEILLYPGLSICYESPYRLLDTLHTMMTLDPQCTLFLAREITKTFETLLQGTLADLLPTLPPPKGECTLIFQPSHLKNKKTSTTKMTKG